MAYSPNSASSSVETGRRPDGSWVSRSGP